MQKGYGNFLRVLKALKWHGLRLTPKDAAYIRPLSKKFNIVLEPTFRLKQNATFPTLDYVKTPDGYWLKTGSDVKDWAVENYMKFSPFAPDKSSVRLEAIKSIPTEGAFILERLVFL
jgi:hypothetical protein